MCLHTDEQIDSGFLMD
uniref:Uncharacterized protein n=1 Tax=Arundo donax TaxID=35708 RepID=A0A0A8Y3D7_ARUDO